DVLNHEFTQVGGVFELRDGRILVSDRRDEAVLVADVTTGRTQPVGRKGSGPEEYRMPGRFSRWRGDSIQMNDQGNARLAIIGPDLRIHRTFVLSVPGLPTTVAPRGIDSHGRMYAQVPRWAASSLYGVHGDSAPIVRVTAPGRPAEVVTWVLLAADPGPVKKGLPYVPFSPEDIWSFSPDGRLAIARSNDYHVEWRDAEGRVTKGPANAFLKIPVAQIDKIAYTRRFMETTTIGGRGSGSTMPSGESPLPPEMLEAHAIEEMARVNPFAPVKPPFTDAMPLVAPNGEFWVERSVSATVLPLWDVFDASGQMVRRYQAPPGRRLVALGKGTAYAVVQDRDGLEKVERYRLR
ncbi:MAG: hypothetical protein ABI836_12135, partial [Gemmatimonadota bacterium]